MIFRSHDFLRSITIPSPGVVPDPQFCKKCIPFVQLGILNHTIWLILVELPKIPMRIIDRALDPKELGFGADIAKPYLLRKTGIPGDI